MVYILIQPNPIYVVISKPITQGAKGFRGFGDPIVDVSIRCERIVDKWTQIPEDFDKTDWASIINRKFRRASIRSP